MSHCINIRDKRYVQLVHQSMGLWNSNPVLNEEELKARISTWQDFSNTDEFPKLEYITEDITIDLDYVEIGDRRLTFNADMILRKLNNMLDDKSKSDDIYYILTSIASNLNDSIGLLNFKNNLKYLKNKNFMYYENLSNIDKYRVGTNYDDIIRVISNKEEWKDINDFLSHYDDKVSALVNMANEFFLTNGDHWTGNKTLDNKLNLLLNNRDEIINNYTLLRNIFVNNILNIEEFINYDINQDDIDKLIDKRDKVKKKLFNNQNSAKASEVLKALSNDKNNQLAKALYSIIDTNDVVINLTDQILNVGAEVHRGKNMIDNKGHYDPNTNEINLTISGTNKNIILHEIVHSLTQYYLSDDNNANNEDIKAFKELFNELVKFKEDFSTSNQYFLSNLDEFIAGIFTEQSFINELSKIKPINKTKKFSDIFDELIDSILRILGFNRNNKTNKTLYDEAYNIASNVLDGASKRPLATIDIENWNSEIPFSPVNTRIEKLKSLNENFTAKEIKERSTSIATMFSEIITSYELEPENKFLNRQEVIDKVTPLTLFQDVKTEFEYTLEDYKVELTDLQNIKSKPERQKILKNRIDNLSKTLQFFDELSVSAVREIGNLEGIIFYDSSSITTEKFDKKEENDFAQSEMQDMADDYEMGEYKILDGWQTNYLHTSISDSMTQKIMSLLRFIPEVNKQGKEQLDALGFTKRLDPGIAKNTILSSLQNMLTSKDMIPLLRKEANNKPWLNGVINKLVDRDDNIIDNELFSQFYQTFRNDLTNFSINKTFLQKDGTITYQTVDINDVNTINYYINEWKTNISEDIVIARTKSVYVDGNLNKNNANNNIKAINQIKTEWEIAKTRGTVDEVYSNREVFIDKNISNIKSYLDAIGVSTSTDTLREIFSDTARDKQGRVFSFNIDTVLNNLLNINNWVVNNSNLSVEELVSNNNNNYKNLSKLFIDNLESIIESYVHENGKGYYSYLKPSYIGKLIKNLKNVYNDKTRFNKFIQDEFKQYENFLYDTENNKFYISWLNDLVDETDDNGNIIIDNNKNRNLLDQKIQLNFNKVDYDSLDAVNYSLSMLVEYFSNDDTAWFRVPIMSDAPVSRFIKFNKITGNNYKDNVINKLMDLFNYEYNRIKVVKSMNESGTPAIQNFNKLGTKFVFLPFFNDRINEIETLLDNRQTVEATSLIKNILEENLDRKANEDFEYYRSIGLFEKAENGYKYLKGLGINDANIREKFSEFYYNDFLASANIIQLTTTDLAYYKNVEDFQKRFKQVNAPGSLLNTMAEYNGERIGKDEEVTIYISDQEVVSNVVDNIIENIINNDRLSPIDKANIVAAYGASNYTDKDGKKFYKVNYNNKDFYIPTKYINVTDAQAYRSLPSYKSIIGMSNGWNDKLENAYQNLMNDNWDMNDYNTIFQAIKPFMYTQHPINTGNQEETKIKVPVQNKNSETLLLPIFVNKKGNDKLKAIHELMVNHGIDVIQFESAVKVGAQNILDINNINKKKDIINYVLDNKDFWQRLSYEDYKIQQPIPDHLQDSEQLVGTQIRKLIMSDISSDARFTIANTTFSKKEWTELYNNVNIENIIESYIKVREEFSDPVKLQNIIEKEIFGNKRYATDLLYSCQIDPNTGDFVIPLHEPSQSTRVQQLLNSIWKSRVTKQKIKGGSVVQVTSYGLSDDLNIVFNEDGSIKYYEAYLPWWSNNLPTEYVNQETGEINYERIEKEAPEIMEMIAYRIPTEDKYSMLPIRVKGFLPRNAGGNIMLPKEITTITGSDFDKH